MLLVVCCRVLLRALHLERDALELLDTVYFVFNGNSEPEQCLLYMCFHTSVLYYMCPHAFILVYDMCPHASYYY